MPHIDSKACEPKSVEPASIEPRELAVLLHGISSSRVWMWPLAQRLRRRGFDARLWTYFTLLGSIRDKGKQLAEHLHRLAEQDRWSRIHLVVHSMGSIVTRCALQEDLPACFGRVVMLSPPNGGSHMATRLLPTYGRVSLSLAEMSDQPDSFVNQLPGPPEGVEIGVLAAKYDHVIHLDRTHLPGQRDHQVVNTWHTGVLWRPETADLAAQFLRTGSFATAMTEVGHDASTI